MKQRALFAGPAAFLALVFAFALPAIAEVAVPPLEARVTDLTGTLTSAQKISLEGKLRAFEQRKGSQLAVLIVPSTAPEDIAQFGIRVADAWKLGRQGIDDGAILIVAKDQRRMRVEVGRGLEGVLTDALSHRIIEETIAPRFREGDYFGGIDSGLDRMIGLIDGEPLPEPDARWSGRSTSGHVRGIQAFLPLVIPAFFMLVFARSFFGRGPSALVTGGLVGIVAWIFTHLLMIAIIAGVVGFVFALLSGALFGPSRWTSGRRGGWGSGGYWPGGGWSGGGRGGFGGGGGFRGGGGGFGGGGASGGW